MSDFRRTIFVRDKLLDWPCLCYSCSKGSEDRLRIIRMPDCFMREMLIIEVRGEDRWYDSFP